MLAVSLLLLIAASAVHCLDDLYVPYINVFDDLWNSSIKTFTVPLLLKNGSLPDAGLLNGTIQFSIQEEFGIKIFQRKNLTFNRYWRRFNYDGVYMGVLEWMRTYDNKGIQINGYVTDAENNYFLNVEEIRNGIVRSTLARKKIQFIRHLKLWVGSYDGDSSVIQAGAIGRIRCIIYNSKPDDKPTIIKNVTFFKETWAYDAYAKDYRIYFKARMEDNYQTIRCQGANTSRTGVIRVFSNQTYPSRPRTNMTGICSANLNTSMLENKIQTLTNSIAELEKKLATSVNNIIDFTKYSVMELKERLDNLKGSVKFSNSEIDKMKQMLLANILGFIDKSEAKPKTLKEQKIKEVVTYDWKVENITARRKQASTRLNEVIYSDFFYSHPNGYRMRMELCPAACGYARKQYISLFFRTCVGPFDKSLPEKVKMTVRLGIADQIREGYYFSQVSQSEYSKAKSECNTVQGGSSQLIEFSTLISSPVAVVNDTVVFRISIGVM